MSAFNKKIANSAGSPVLQLNTKRGVIHLSQPETHLSLTRRQLHKISSWTSKYVTQRLICSFKKRQEKKNRCNSQPAMLCYGSPAGLLAPPQLYATNLQRMRISKSSGMTPANQVTWSKNVDSHCFHAEFYTWERPKRFRYQLDCEFAIGFGFGAV